MTSSDTVLSDGTTATLVTPQEPIAWVLLVHGIFSNRHDSGRFERLAQRLAEVGVSSSRIDLPGHGDHPVASADLSFEHLISSVDNAKKSSKELAGELPYGLVTSSFGGLRG